MSETRRAWGDFWVQHEDPWYPVVHSFPLDPKVEPYALTQAEVIAIKCLYEGNASDFQQKLAFDALVKKVCATYDATFRPGANGDRASVFAEGRRWVGLQIVKALNLTIKQSGDNPSAPRKPERKHQKPGPSKRRKPGQRDPGSEAVS